MPGVAGGCLLVLHTRYSEMLLTLKCSFELPLAALCAGVHVWCAAHQLSPLLGPRDRVNPQLGPVLPLPLAGLVPPFSSHGLAAMLQLSHTRQVAALDWTVITVDNYRRQWTVTEGGLGGLEAPIFSSPSFHFIWGTYLNTIFALLKCYN